MNKKKITTGLIGKQEVFKVMALGEVTGLGTLLIGVPGTAKTRSVLDYAKSSYATTGELLKNTYILETDEGTKASEVKGRVDLEKLTTENKYVLNSPITKSKYIVINEVDKGSSAIRNSLLGIMNEKILFNGDSKVPCQWKLFVATCNEIPEDEKDSPFWDRFMLKTTVNRMTAAQMTTYFEAGDKAYSTSVNVPMPTAAEIANVSIPVDKLEVFVQMTKNSLSDRTLTFVPNIAKAVALIWNVSIDKALIKTCELVAGRVESQNLAKALVPAEMRVVFDQLDMLNANIDDITAKNIMSTITNTINANQANGTFTESQIDELSLLIQDKINNNEIGYLNKQEAAPIQDAEVIIDASGGTAW